MNLIGPMSCDQKGCSHYNVPLQLDNLTSREEIDCLLDEDKYMAIVNNSGWPTTRVLTLRNRVEFIDGLIRQNLITSREAAITAFGKGMELLGLRSLIQRHWSELREVFVFSNQQQISATQFLHLIVTKLPSDEDKQQVQAHRWFMDYVHERDTMGMLCMFFVTLTSL